MSRSACTPRRGRRRSRSTRSSPQAERLDRAAALDRLADGAGESARTPRAPTGSRRARGARYHRVPTKSSGTPARQGSAATGLTQMAAATVSTVVTAAISVSGTAKRTVRASASTSAVVRETRSPVPARSTVESGRASTRRMKSSRSSANILSREDERRAPREPGEDRLRDQERGEHEHDLVDVRARSCRPGPTGRGRRAARAGEPRGGSGRVQADHPGQRAPVAAAEARAWARSSAPVAIGRSSFIRPPRG